jgi:Methyltransferase domain
MKTVDELVAFSDACESGISIVNVCTYSEPELRALAKCLVDLPMKSRVVEIGTFAGRSASLFFQLQKDLNLDIHLIDNCMWHTEVAMDIFHRMTATYFQDVPYLFHKATSQGLGVYWKLPINFLHVDGHHDLEFVWKDCELYLPHLVPEGIVAFHDSTGESPGVTQAIDHFVKPTYELLETVGRVTTWRKL